MGKRSRSATKGLKPKKVITGAQRKARKINIAVARAAKAGKGRKKTGVSATKLNKADRKTASKYNRDRLRAMGL